MTFHSNYTVNLPNYSIGTDCYTEIPYITRFFGTKAVVIGGKTALSKAASYLLAGVENSSLELTDFIWYGGNSTYENCDMLINHQAVKNADMIFAVGGGRACDAVKVVADKLDKPLFTFPTVGSNCAPVTAVSVMYNSDGTFKDYYYPKLCNHCFIHSSIIADSPERLLWAGIGDALSKEFEVVFSSKDDRLSHTPLMGKQLSHVCTEPLIEYGKSALESIKNHKVSFALEQVILDIIVSTGIVSNLMTTKDDYYYNSTLAHCIYYGATVTANGSAHLHGEVVSLGVLCLLNYEGNQNELTRIMRFNDSIGLPVCFEDIGIKESEFETMLDKIVATTEWTHRPSCVNRDRLLRVMKETNTVGLDFKKKKK